MLHAVDLDATISDNGGFKKRRRALRYRLAELQRATLDARVPVMVAFEGWDAAGKGSLIRALTDRLDPRGFDVHPVRAPRPFERSRPWLWRFWQTIPRRGRWAFYDRSWHGRAMVARMKRIVKPYEWERTYAQINAFEQALSDDGYVIVKLFLHISPEEQERRLTALSSDPATAWQVTPEDWENHRTYDTWVRVYTQALERTHTPNAPWTVVPATCLRHARLTVYETLVDALEDHLDTA